MKEASSSSSNQLPASSSSLSAEQRSLLQSKLQAMEMKDRASFGLVAKYKCFAEYQKARICAQQVYETNEALRRKVLELQEQKEQYQFMHQNYSFILKKCESDILKIGDCVLKGQLN